eukprot:UN04752
MGMRNQIMTITTKAKLKNKKIEFIKNLGPAKKRRKISKGRRKQVYEGHSSDSDFNPGNTSSSTVDEARREDSNDDMSDDSGSLGELIQPNIEYRKRRREKCSQ